MLEYTSKMIQLVLYICASNKEILEDEKQKKILRQPKNHTSIKDKCREVQKWNCGTETKRTERWKPDLFRYASPIGTKNTQKTKNTTFSILVY